MKKSGTCATGNFVSRWTKAIQEMPSTYAHPACESVAIPTEAPAVTPPRSAPAAAKLTEAQKRVMKWIGRGWTAQPGAGSAIMVNGARICNVDTMMALCRVGLASKDEFGHWVATPSGEALTRSMGL